MKLRANPTLNSFSVNNEIDCIVTHDHILEVSTDIFEFCKSNYLESVEDLLNALEDDTDQIAEYFDVGIDSILEMLDTIESMTEDYIDVSAPPTNDKISLSNFDDEIEIYESDEKDFADIPDED